MCLRKRFASFFQLKRPTSFDLVSRGSAGCRERERVASTVIVSVSLRQRFLCKLLYRLVVYGHASLSQSQ